MVNAVTLIGNQDRERERWTTSLPYRSENAELVEANLARDCIIVNVCGSQREATHIYILPELVKWPAKLWRSTVDGDLLFGRCSYPAETSPFPFSAQMRASLPPTQKVYTFLDFTDVIDPSHNIYLDFSLRLLSIIKSLSVDHLFHLIIPIPSSLKLIPVSINSLRPTSSSPFSPRSQILERSCGFLNQARAKRNIIYRYVGMMSRGHLGLSRV